MRGEIALRIQEREKEAREAANRSKQALSETQEEVNNDHASMGDSGDTGDGNGIEQLVTNDIGTQTELTIEDISLSLKNMFMTLRKMS